MPFRVRWDHGAAIGAAARLGRGFVQPFASQKTATLARAALRRPSVGPIHFPAFPRRGALNANALGRGQAGVEKRKLVSAF